MSGPQKNMMTINLLYTWAGGPGEASAQGDEGKVFFLSTGRQRNVTMFKNR